jgi:hypothetical protein
MFFIRWEEALCVLFFERYVIRRHEVPDEIELFKPAQYPPSRIKFTLV